VDGGAAQVFGPERARLEVLTFREGLLSAVAHDLLLRAIRFEVAIDPARQAVTVRIDAGSLRVVTALREGRPLPNALRPADVRDIEQTIAERVLQAGRWPEIRFASTAVSRHGDGYELRGELSLAGVTREVAFAASRQGDRLAAELPLHQPDFGIRPYRAMMGTLRVRPDVVVRTSLPAEGF
jgi:polyisoprenoid-binding protein YceI